MEEQYPSRRKDALNMGINKYFTNTPCKNGHVDFRYTDSGVCHTCITLNSRNYLRVNKDIMYPKVKAWRESKPDYDKSYYARNAERVKQHAKRWKLRNPERVTLLMDRRGAKLKRATPCWFETELVKLVYIKRDELSTLLGIDLTVDHIIPIQSDTVWVALLGEFTINRKARKWTKA